MIRIMQYANNDNVFCKVSTRISSERTHLHGCPMIGLYKESSYLSSLFRFRSILKHTNVLRDKSNILLILHKHSLNVNNLESFDTLGQGNAVSSYLLRCIQCIKGR